MTIGAIIQARTSSSRLPQKVLKTLPYESQTTVLEQVIQRVKAVSRIQKIIVATTTEPEDDAIVKIAQNQNTSTFRGSLQHVLQRFYEAARQYELDYIVRITSDCPCIDPAIISRVIDEHFSQKADFTSSALERTFPVGQDLSIFSMQLLKEAYQNATQNYEKEHVTTYFYRAHPEKYNIHVVKAPGAQLYPQLRLTLDTPEDYTFLCTLFDYLYEKNNLFGLNDILTLIRAKPWLQNINQKVVQKNVHHNLKDEIQEGIAFSEKQGLLKLKDFLLQQLNKD